MLRAVPSSYRPASLTALIFLRAYQLIEDAWLGGVEEWCRAASDCVLNGGQAWMVTASDGQANWIKHRLLRANVSLFGVQFLDVRTLRRELGARFGFPAQALGQETLGFLLRLRALTAVQRGSPRCSAVARHPGTCLAALDDYAAAGWLDEPGLLDEILPEELADWLPQLRNLGAWTPEIDRQLLRTALARRPTPAEPLSVCFYGWDAGDWPHLNLMAAAVHAAHSAVVFIPSPRGTSEGLQQEWLEACEETFQTSFEPCNGSNFVSAQAKLAGRLEGTDLDPPADSGHPAPPTLLTGVEGEDMAALVCDFVARWLAALPKAPSSEADVPPRLAILCPGRGPSSVQVTRALAAAEISIEDELGEIAAPSLALQIQRAILDYHQDRSGLNGLLTLVELLNQQAATSESTDAKLLHAVFPLDPVEVRRALHGAFAEVQHHDVRVLCDAGSLTRSKVGDPLRRFISHLESWPETLPWREALRRWCICLHGLGISIDDLEPLWSKLQTLAVPDPVPSAAFFDYLGTLLVGGSVRRAPEASHRFAQIVITTLEGAAGQIWGGLVLLDSNEGAWPLYPPENPFFADAVRARFNARRSTEEPTPGHTRPGRLLTSADRAQLEHFHFLEALENCTGPLAFASLIRHPAEANRELYPNEWLLRCLVESDAGAIRDEKLLERWRRTAQGVARPPARLSRAETTYLRHVHASRRDPALPFDEHFFNFQSLTGPDQLPWADPWSAHDLDTAWNQPATFAMSQVFGAEPWQENGKNLTRAENCMVGRLVHRWLQNALGLSKAPRHFQPEDWSRALAAGLPRVLAETTAALRVSLAKARPAAADTALPLWWQGVLQRSAWATYRCLKFLAETAAASEQPECWLCLSPTFDTQLHTASGPLRLTARCDIVLLDRPEMKNAACQLLDVRTGTAPSAGPLSAAQLQAKSGLSLAVQLFMARAAGADPLYTRVGAIHPDAANPALADHACAPLLEPLLDRLARQQHTLVFGQKGATTDEAGHTQVENLPLATIPIDPAILAFKMQLHTR